MSRPKDSSNQNHSDEKLQVSELEEQIKLLKTLVISLAGAYQANYDTFASAQNFSQDVKDAIGEEAYEQLFRVFSRFCTIQGSAYRDFVEDLSNLPLPQSTLSVEKAVAIFNYDKVEVRKARLKKYSGKKMSARIEKLKEIYVKVKG